MMDSVRQLLSSLVELAPGPRWLDESLIAFSGNDRSQMASLVISPLPDSSLTVDALRNSLESRYSKQNFKWIKEPVRRDDGSLLAQFNYAVQVFETTRADLSCTQFVCLEGDLNFCVTITSITEAHALVLDQIERSYGLKVA